MSGALAVALGLLSWLTVVVAVVAADRRPRSTGRRTAAATAQRPSQDGAMGRLEFR